MLDESVLKETNEQSKKYGSETAEAWDAEPEAEAPDLSPEDREVLAELDEFFAEFDEPDEDTSESDSTEDEFEEFGKKLQDSKTTEPHFEDSENEDEQFDFSNLVDELAEEEDKPQETPSSFSDAPQSDYDELTEPPKSGFSKPPIISSTYGEILISQGQLTQALSVFTKLLERDPDNKRYQKKVEQLKQMIARQNQ